MIYTVGMASNEALGKSIRDARLDKGMSLGQLASAVGRSSSSVRRWERGEVSPGAGSMTKLVAILELDREAFDAKPAETVSGLNNQDADAEASDKRVATFEQPAIPQAPTEPSSDELTGEVPKVARGGLLSDVWSVLGFGKRSWIGWIRGLLTFVALTLMAFVLIWAVGELVSALDEVRNSVDVGTGSG